MTDTSEHAATDDLTECDERASAHLRRGHHAKLADALRALEATGLFPPNLRPAVRDRLVEDWLKDNGYAGDMPSRSAIGRFFRERTDLAAATADAHAK